MLCMIQYLVQGKNSAWLFFETEYIISDVEKAATSFFISLFIFFDSFFLVIGSKYLFLLSL